MYALITGASSGIGKEIARLLAQKRYHLILTARRQNNLEQLKAELTKKYPIDVVILATDLSIPENCHRLHEQCKPYDVEIVINNAGFGKVGRFEQISLEQELSMIQTNVVAVHLLTKLFVRSMKKGHILNVASMAGFQPDPMMAAYGATKAYVLSLSQAVNYELKKHKIPIMVSTLCPGPVDTEFNSVANAHFNISSMSADRCAKAAIDGLFKNKSIIIPGLKMKLIHLLSKLSPAKVVVPFEYRIQSQKVNP